MPLKIFKLSAKLAPGVAKGGIMNWFRSLTARRRARNARLRALIEGKKGKRGGDQLVPALEGARP